MFSIKKLLNLKNQKINRLSLEIYLKQLANRTGWDYLEWERSKSRKKNHIPNLTESYANIIINSTTRLFTDRFIHEGHLTPAFEYYTQTQNCYKITGLFITF